MKGSVAITRNTTRTVSAVTFVDDIVVGWDGPECIGEVCLVWACDYGDGRVVLRREQCDIIIGSIGDKPALKIRVPLKPGDEVALQWRAVTPTTTALSEVAELTIGEVEDGE